MHQCVLLVLVLFDSVQTDARTAVPEPGDSPTALSVVFTVYGGGDGKGNLKGGGKGKSE